MIVFQVSLNFDPVKEILKIRCQIYMLMKKVIILWKIQVTMNILPPSFFKHFCLSLNRKKTCGNERHEKVTTETKHIHASTADLLHIRIGKLDWNESYEKETKHIHASAADLLQ